MVAANRLDSVVRSSLNIAAKVYKSMFVYLFPRFDLIRFCFKVYSKPQFRASGVADELISYDMLI